MLLAELVNENTINKNFVAPPGMVYEIHSINYAIVASGSNVFAIRSKWESDQTTRLNINSKNEALLFVTYTQGGYTTPNFVFGYPARCKVLSLCASTNTTFTGVVLINYTLKKATEAELLWDYIANERR